MGDDSRIPLSYAKPDLALRANWPAAASLVCALVYPASCAVAPHLLHSSRAAAFVDDTAYFIIWVISGLAAAVFGLIGLMRSSRLKVGGWRIALLGLLFGVCNLGAVPIVRQYLSERASYDYGIGHGFTRCASHMKSIGQGIMLFANENQGRFPDRLEDVILTQEIGSESFICPLSNDVAAAGPTTQAIAANLSLGGHLSYVYLGKGMTTQPEPDPKLVLLYEHLNNHTPHVDWLWFLFADGHVDRFPRAQAEKMIDQLKAGTNPPKP